MAREGGGHGWKNGLTQHLKTPPTRGVFCPIKNRKYPAPKHEIDFSRLAIFRAQNCNMKNEITIVRFKDACKLCGKSRAGLYRAIAAGLWPPPIRVSQHASGFTLRELEVMNAAIISGRGDDDLRHLARELKESRQHLLREVLAE